MPSALAISASVCLISSLSSGGNDLGKPGGRHQDTQSSVSVITPSNTNTSSVNNPAQVTPSNNTKVIIKGLATRLI
jgi:hypothetical protein